MKSLKDFNNEKVQNNVLQKVTGGNLVKTSYDCGSGDGSQGDDVTGDTNGDGVSGGSGDFIVFDDGSAGTIT